MDYALILLNRFPHPSPKIRSWPFHQFPPRFPSLLTASSESPTLLMRLFKGIRWQKAGLTCHAIGSEDQTAVLRLKLRDSHSAKAAASLVPLRAGLEKAWLIYQ